ncbi:MAG TPA: carbohydrate ABC transporter permease [Firmicutes bacterium]|nr:carbohydrate ABC transporter permease [Bacillota bacterium]
MPYITRAGKGGVPRFRHHKQEVYHKIAAFGKAALRTAFLLGIGFVMLYPVLFILSGAFKAKQDVYDPTVIWFPKHYSLEAMGLALDTLKFGKSVGRTLAILVPSVLLQMVSTLMAGYGFARFRFRERGILFALLIFTIIVPVQNLIVPLYANFQSFDMLGAGYLFGAVTGEGLPNLLDTNLPFYLMAAFGMGIRSGLYIFIMRQFFRNMPAELEEAALIDGCGSVKTFTRVMLPNVVPALVTVLVFSIVWYWNDYYQASMFLMSDQTLSVNLTMLNGMLSITAQNVAGLTSQDLMLMRDAVLECGCLVTLLPLLVMYLFLQRFFTESIERTGIVG